MDPEEETQPRPFSHPAKLPLLLALGGRVRMQAGKAGVPCARFLCHVFWVTLHMLTLVKQVDQCVW